MDDLIAAADHLRKSYAAPAILIGHSLGGTAMLAAAHKIPEARGVVTIAAPYHPNHVTNLFKADIDKLRKQGEIEVSLAGRAFRIKREFLDDVAEKNLQDCISPICARRCWCSTHRLMIWSASRMPRKSLSARSIKSFISLAGADHLLRAREVMPSMWRTLIRRLGRSLPRSSPKL